MTDYAPAYSKLPSMELNSENRLAIVVCKHAISPINSHAGHRAA